LSGRSERKRSAWRARIENDAGKITEWRSRALPRYQRLTRKAEALIAAVYLAGTNTRRVKRALFGLFQGAVGKDVVSRAWRKVKVDWDAWCARSAGDCGRTGVLGGAGDEAVEVERGGFHFGIVIL